MTSAVATTTIIGIDPSSRSLTFCIGDGDGTGPLSIVKHMIKGSSREIQCNDAYEAIIGILAQYDDILIIGLEAPVLGRGGPGSTIPQAMISGAVQAALGGSDVPIELVNNQEWKKSVVGAGNADKLKIVSWVSENEPEAFRDCRTATGLVDQDKCDAVCIYLHMVKLVRGRMKLQRQLTRRRNATASA